ncbi:MAG: TetR/AcrR family transcriptional regulator [Candidatus Binatota bacterium]|jgi:AcrR family transcriptional regulator|nr:TetR/AcrR family transcriptional regulator [Candidatus Binatota bacterium]
MGSGLRKKPPRSTRDRVLAVAAEIFAERGYGLTAMRDIARAARLRVATLYHHFRSKEELYREVLDREQAKLRDMMNTAFAEETDFTEQVGRAVGMAVDHHRANPHLAKLGLRALLGDGLTRPYDVRWLGMMDALLRPRATKGEIKDVDPALFLISAGAMIMHHAIAGQAYRELLDGRGEEELARRTREHVVQIVLRTLGLDRAEDER